VPTTLSHEECSSKMRQSSHITLPCEGRVVSWNTRILQDAIQLTSDFIISLSLRQWDYLWQGLHHWCYVSKERIINPCFNLKVTWEDITCKKISAMFPVEISMGICHSRLKPEEALSPTLKVCIVVCLQSPLEWQLG